MSFGSGRSNPAAFLNWRRESPLWALAPTVPSYVTVPIAALATRPPFDDPALLLEYRSRLEQIPGVELSGAGTRPSFPLAVLGDPAVVSRIEEVLAWFAALATG